MLVRTITPEVLSRLSFEPWLQWRRRRALELREQLRQGHLRWADYQTERAGLAELTRQWVRCHPLDPATLDATCAPVSVAQAVFGAVVCWSAHIMPAQGPADVVVWSPQDSPRDVLTHRPCWHILLEGTGQPDWGTRVSLGEAPEGFAPLSWASPRPVLETYHGFDLLVSTPPPPSPR